MAQELKLIPHDDGLLALIDDPTWSRHYPALVAKRLALMLATLMGLTALITAGLYAVGIDTHVGSVPGFLVGMIGAIPVGLVHTKSSLAVHVDQVGLTIQPLFGTVRTSEVMDGVANRKPAKVGGSVPQRRILWEDVDDVVWSDVHLEIRHGEGQVERFDLEDYARADITRLGEAIGGTWKHTNASRDSPEQADVVRAQLAQLASKRPAEHA